MEMRNLLEHEIPLAMELKISCWPEELAGKAEHTLKLEEENRFWTNWMNTASKNNDMRLLLGAFEGSQLMGVALASFVDSKSAPENGIELNGLWVFPQYRGKGLSLSLIKEVLDFYIPLGATKMEVYCFHHAPSNAFYRKFGGAVIGTEYQLDGKVPVDIFEFDIPALKSRLDKRLTRANTP
jgi:GNAT superfamily N-acetyltransferase